MQYTIGTSFKQQAITNVAIKQCRSSHYSILDFGIPSINSTIE